MKTDLTQGVEFSHLIFKEHIGTGSIVVDATAGRGLDTLYLARLVGSNGKVFAFDIQERAIKETRERLVINNLEDRVKLINEGHETMDKFIKVKIDGILFNLGYLPGGDKRITTKANTTIKALKSGLKLLKAGGLIVLVVYTGQQGGKEEKESLLAFCEKLDYREYNVLHYHFMNQEKEPPQVIAIKKRFKGDVQN